MAPRPIAELMSDAAAATEPRFIAEVTVKLGGVDPLGLRQINFELMDMIFPGLNNVARHIRPFVLVTWAWRRARQLAESRGGDQISKDLLLDFVDRMEVIYAWSQFLRDPGADLPGRIVFKPLLFSDAWTFGGEAWRKQREDRRYSTAFTAPVNYGPSLKAFRWLSPHPEHANVFVASSRHEVVAAINAFEQLIFDRLEHPAFSQFGEVRVTAQEARDWAESWALNHTTDAERHAMRAMLRGSESPVARQQGLGLLIATAAHHKKSLGGMKDVDAIRLTMAGRPSNFVPPSGAAVAMEGWRRLQIRQLFRLSLEALLYWIIIHIEATPLTTQALVGSFLAQVGLSADTTTHEWLGLSEVANASPVTLMNDIASALRNPAHEQLAAAIARGLALSLAEAPEQGQPFERLDRLPLFRARREYEAWATASATSFATHILESWVLSQHVYWSVGRGLADARARGKTLLRLRVVLDDGGWKLTPGASGSVPVPTPDRLATALSLADECGLLECK